MDERFSAEFNFVGCQQKRGEQLLRVVAEVSDVFTQCSGKIGINSFDGFIIANAKQDRSSAAVQKCTNCFEQAGRQFVLRPFELNW